MRESGPRGPETSREARELLEHPEQVFDSDKEMAQEEARELAKRLERIGETKREGSNAIFETMETESPGGAPQIQIAWPAKKGVPSTMLRLIPHTEGQGPESGIFGYSGEYGITNEVSGKHEFDIEPMSLEELFGVPKDINLIIVPTATRWAIAKDQMAVAFGENTRTLYMGLGFLFRGPEFMQVGMHEAGHLAGGANGTHTHNENKAWTFANRRYAALHDGLKDQVIAGKNTGLFDLLKRPMPYGNSTTIGKIARYGLTSHAIAGGDAHISKQWRDQSERTMDEFKSLIELADQDYDYMVGG